MRSATTIPTSRSRSGFSLIEVMLVVVIVAIAATGTTYALGALTRTRLRSACMKLVAASRWAYNHSIVTGNTTRIRLDFDDATMALEESADPVTLAAVGKESAGEDEDGAAIDPWKAAEERLGDPMTAQLGRSPFGPILGPDGKALSRYAAQSLGDGVRLLRIYTPHEADPREEGIGAIYFFPGGTGEHTVVQLVDSSDIVYSVEIQALSGRAKVYAYPYEPEDLLSEEDEVRDSR